MNSFNHYAYGCVAGWLYRTVAGIRPDPERGGYRHFLLQPVPDPRLGWAKASLRTEAGTIVSSWRYRADGTCEFKFTVPEGTTATVTWNGTSREYGPGTHAE